MGEVKKQFFLEKNKSIPERIIVLYSRAILSYLTAAYAKDDALYPKDIRIRAVVDQRLQFDLGTLSQRMGDYFVIKLIFNKIVIN